LPRITTSIAKKSVIDKNASGISRSRSSVDPQGIRLDGTVGSASVVIGARELVSSEKARIRLPIVCLRDPKDIPGHLADPIEAVSDAAFGGRSKISGNGETT